MNYIEKLSAIRDFTNLGIKSRKHFSRREKWLISRYFNILKHGGYIEYDKDENHYIQKSKFQKKKKSNVKGAPRVKGQFIRGAKPNDRITKSGKIIRENYSKEFIPLDFEPAIIWRDETGENEDDIDEGTAEEILLEALTPYYGDLKPSDYFTIVLTTGHEIGQDQRSDTIKSKRREGRAYTKGLSKERKIEELTYQIIELLRKSINQYKIAELIKGLYLWQFFNQKEPSKKQRKLITKNKRKKRKR